MKAGNAPHTVVAPGMGRFPLLVLTPLVLSGCMMAGMMGSGHGGPAGGQSGSSSAPMSGPTVVKETVANGVRLTANFPHYVFGDDLIYTVQVRSAGPGTPLPEASVYMVVTPLHSASHEAEGNRVAPVENRGGTFVFRPATATAGTYRLTVVVDRFGTTALDSTVQVEHAVQLMESTVHPPGGQSWLAGVTPIVVIGAAAMVLMMVFAFR